MHKNVAIGAVCAFALVVPAFAQSKVYIVCEKAGAMPVVALAERKPGGEVAVLAASEGAAGSCADKSVHEIREQRRAVAQEERGAGAARKDGRAVAQGASLLGGVIPGAGIVSARLREALSREGGVPVVDQDAPQLAPATRAAVSNVLKTKHDTVKNSIMNVR